VTQVHTQGEAVGSPHSAGDKNRICAHTHQNNWTFLVSVALAIATVVVRYLVYAGVEMPPAFPTGGFLLQLIGYLVLLAGNLFEGA
jgi:hypothetical protein